MAGLVDQTFGSQGIVITNVTPGNDSAINSCVLQPNGKIVVTGYGNNGNNVFALARYNSNGSPDTSFGSQGIVITDVSPGNDSAIRSCVLQSDDKIVVAGIGNNAINSFFALARYNSNGSLDTSFGTQGIVTTDVSPGGDSAINSCVLQPDGKIVAAGYKHNGLHYFFTLARYNSNGSLDTTFGTQGIVITDITPGSNSQINSCVLQPDGKIVVAGIGNNGNNVFTLARYNNNGSLDTTFGTQGIVITDITPVGNSAINSCMLQPDDKIVAAGYKRNGAHYFFTLARYNSNGSLDTSFGSQGIVITDVSPGGDSAINSCMLQLDSKIVAAGYERNAPYRFFTLARYNNNGSLDTTFGTQGIVTTKVARNFSQISSCVLQPDGKIIATGVGGNGINNVFAITRYINPFSLISFTDSYGGVGLL